MYLNQIHAKMRHVVAEYDVHGMSAKSTGPLHGQNASLVLIFLQQQGSQKLWFDET